MKIVVAGSRGLFDKDKIFDILSHSKFEISEIITGGAKGVDLIAEEYARLNAVPVKTFSPHYSIDNPRSAPLLRNVSMSEYGDGLIAIWDGKSRGTEHMIKCMERLDKPIEVFIIS